jgi:tetratricopeptide (TPR) repeat protein
MKSSLFRRILAASVLFMPLSVVSAQPIGGAPPTKAPAKADAPANTATQPPAGGDNPAAGTAGSKENKDENVDRAFAIFREGKEDEAYKLLQDAAKKNEKLPPVRLMMHRMFMAVGKIPQARQALELAAVETPDHPDIYITFGDYALREARYTDAMLQFQKAASLMQDSKKWNDLQRKNVLLACYSGLSRAAQGRSQWEESRKNIDAALKLDFSKSQLAGFHQEMGKILFMLDKPDDAKKEMDEAEKDEPAIDPTGVSMAKLYSAKASRETNQAKQKELFGKAKEWFEYAIKKDPKSFKAHINYAVWLFDMNYQDKTYLERAKEEVEEGAKLDPKSDDVHLLRGLIHRFTGNYEAAETEFDLVNREKPNEFAPANQLVLVLLEQASNPAKQQRARMLAEENYKKNAGRIPESAATMGWVLLRNGQSEDAEKLIGQALQSGQVSADMLYYYAKVLQNRTQLDRAADVLKAAVNSPGRFMYRREAAIMLDQITGKGGGTPSK